VGNLPWTTSPVYESLANLLVKQFGKTRAIKIISGKAKLTATEQQFLTATKTNLYYGDAAESLLSGYGLGVTRAITPTGFEYDFGVSGIPPSTTVLDYGSQQAAVSASARASAEAVTTQLAGTAIKQAVAKDVARAFVTPDISSMLIGAGATQLDSKIKTKEITIAPQIGLIEELEIKPKTKEKTLLKAKQREKQRAVTLSSLISPLTTTVTKQFPAFVQIPTPRQAQITKQRQAQVVKTRQLIATDFGLTPMGFAPPTIKIPDILIPPTPRLTKSQQQAYKQRQAQARRQQKAYQASVGAWALGLEMPTMKIPSGKTRYTGLELRYLVKEDKKKKKRPTIKNISRFIGGF